MLIPHRIGQRGIGLDLGGVDKQNPDLAEEGAVGKRLSDEMVHNLEKRTDHDHSNGTRLIVPDIHKIPLPSKPLRKLGASDHLPGPMITYLPRKGKDKDKYWVNEDITILLYECLPFAYV